MCKVTEQIITKIKSITDYDKFSRNANIFHTFVQELLKHVKNSPNLMENLVEDIVSNPALLKKVLIKILPRIDDESELTNEKSETQPWHEPSYRPGRSSKEYERKSNFELFDL